MRCRTCYRGPALVGKRDDSYTPFQHRLAHRSFGNRRPALIKRILAYNHDDCRATVALRKAVP